jgi:hypothetical protein
MALSDANKAALAFKNTQGKAHTATNKELGNEEEEFRFIVGADTVWLSEITNTPDPTLVEQIVADLVADPTSNGKAYLTYYPASHPTSASQRLYNAVPHSFGNAYEAVIRAADGTRITEFDARDWVYQYQPGIFFQQTAAAIPAPATATVYVYKGDTLKSLLQSGSGSLTGGSQQWEVTTLTSSSSPTFTTTASVVIAGPTFTLTGSGTVFSNEVLSNYTVDPATKELTITSIYPMTCSVANTGTIFTLTVPTSGRYLDADITILGKTPDMNKRAHFKYNMVAYTSASAMHATDELTVLRPDIKNDRNWDYNVDINGNDILFTLTGSNPATNDLIDWSLHGSFHIL